MFAADFCCWSDLRLNLKADAYVVKYDSLFVTVDFRSAAGDYSLNKGIAYVCVLGLIPDFGLRCL